MKGERRLLIRVKKTFSNYYLINMGFISEFKEFLNEYKIMALAIAFIMGVALTALVQSLVNDIVSQ